MTQDISSKEMDPTCIQCGIPLTELETLAGDSCYMCGLAAIEELEIKTKKKLRSPPPPEEFGRTEDDIRAYKKAKRDPLDLPNAPSVEKEGITWKPKDRKFFMMKFGYDPAKIQRTNIVATVADDTTLTFAIPEIVQESYQRLVQDILDRTLDGIMKLLIYGPHSNEIKRMLDGPDDYPPQPGPPGG
jgi:hypothetical protein